MDHRTLAANLGIKKPNKPRILVVTPRLPYPVVGGDRLRIFKISEHLSREFDLDLITLCESTHELELPIPNDGVFSTVQRILLPRWRSWLNCAAALFSSTPLQVAYYRSAELELSTRNRAKGAVAVLAHLIRTAEAVRNLDTLRILEMTDAISLNYARSRRHFNPFSFRSLLHVIEARRVHKYEREALSIFDLCVLISTVDHQFIAAPLKSAPNKSLVCTNGVDGAYFQHEYRPDGRTIIFIGNQLSYQNADAVRYFVREIFPLVLKEKPEARIRIIGRIDQRQREHLAAMEGVEVTGEVPDIATAATGATVGICPVRIGAGVQNKLLEYMALGVPAITTTVGLEGIEAMAGHDLVVADDPPDFAAQICEMLKDKARANDISKAGRQYVAARHSWERVLAPLAAEIMLRTRPDQITQDQSQH